MSEIPERIVYRNENPEDTNFIYATWLHSYYFGSAFTAHIRKSIYYEYHKEIINRIRESEHTKTLVAASKDDENVIFGYLVYQPIKTPIIQYLYVKGPFQNYGIGTELLTESGIDLRRTVFTHWTQDTKWMIEKFPELTYIPYLIS